MESRKTAQARARVSREDAETVKHELKKLAQEVRYLLKRAAFKRHNSSNRATEDMMEHAWELLYDASKQVVVPPEPPTRAPTR